MNGLVAYNSDSSSGDSSGDEGEDKKIRNEIDESKLHLKKPTATTSVFSTSTVSFCFFEKIRLNSVKLMRPIYLKANYRKFK